MRKQNPASELILNSKYTHIHKNGMSYISKIYPSYYRHLLQLRKKEAEILQFFFVMIFPGFNYSADCEYKLLVKEGNWRWM